VIIASVNPDKLEDFESASSSSRDMKRMQYLIDQLLRTAHMLEINMDVMESMLSMASRVREYDSSSNKSVYDRFVHTLQAAALDHKFQRKNALSVLARATVLSDQVSRLDSLFCRKASIC